MTSQLNVDTIVDKAGSGGTNVKVANTSTYVSDGGNVTQNLVQGSCKHWCDFDTSSTISVYDSFNNSSITDEASGYSSMGYTNNFASQNYVGSGSATGSSYGSPVVMSDQRSTKTTSSLKVRHLHNTTNGSVNPDDVMFHQHGDLA
tara:strand:- start:437 stop:874 length:438 start_codon:yes stop_codon:yes gene_type:complete